MTLLPKATLTLVLAAGLLLSACTQSAPPTAEDKAASDALLDRKVRRAMERQERCSDEVSNGTVSYDCVQWGRGR